MPEVAETIIQVIQLLRSVEVVDGGDKGEMYDDLIVEAEGKRAIGGVTHRFLFALGFDDPEHIQCNGILDGWMGGWMDGFT